MYLHCVLLVTTDKSFNVVQRKFSVGTVNFVLLAYVYGLIKDLKMAKIHFVRETS